jgi:hypothetical protein
MARNFVAIQDDAPSGNALRGHSRDAGFMGESVRGRDAAMLRRHGAHPIAI